MLLLFPLGCILVLVLVCVIVRYWSRKEQEQQRREMAQHIRRDVNSTAGWKEYE